jgi:hypothetical protein
VGLLGVAFQKGINLFLALHFPCFKGFLAYLNSEFYSIIFFTLKRIFPMLMKK